MLAPLFRKSILFYPPFLFFLFIFSMAVLIISGHNTAFAAEGCDEAETLDPDSDAVKTAIDDYANVSGLWRQ